MKLFVPSFQKIEQSFEKTPILHVLHDLKDVDKVGNGNLIYFVRKSLMPIGKIAKV